MGPALAGKLEALADAHGAHAQLFDLCEAQGDWQRLLDHMAASAAGELEWHYLVFMLHSTISRPVTNPCRTF
jgi:hypothetical protein